MTRRPATGDRQPATESGDAPSPPSDGRVLFFPRGSERDAALPEWDARPVALLDGRRLRVASLGAGRLGIRVGMTAAEARAICGELEVLPWDEVAIARAVTLVTGLLIAGSPQVTPADSISGTWWVGASGFVPAGGEPALAGRLLELARGVHPLARVAIADSCVAARAGTWESVASRQSPVAGGHGSKARGQRPTTRTRRSNGDGRARPATGDRPLATAVIIPPGHDADYLSAVPLTLLPIDVELRETLSALGLRTAGALAALGADDVERRWGDVGLAAWRLARGEDRRRPSLARSDRPRSATAELAIPADSVEPVLFLVRAALERLVAQLVADARAAAAVSITLTLDDGVGHGPLLVALPERRPGTPHTITREVRPARPIARVAPLLEQCRSMLARWILPAPVIGVTVAIPATAPAPAEQGDLMTGGWHDATAAEAAFARLRAELGADAVVLPVAKDEHRPERAGGWRDAYGSPVASGQSPVDHLESPKTHDRRHNQAAPLPPATQYPLATGDRRLATDDPLTLASNAFPSSEAGPSGPSGSDVERGSGGGSRPTAALRLLDPPEPVDVEMSDAGPALLWWRGRRIPIAYATGPERLAGSWWREPAAAATDRDYWRCDANDEALLLVQEEAGWVVQGWFD